ncbi:hypothetical protein L218DRAFT_724018 [Marasmius fiardii PR-910]|nr:hypothetical protein L218DRAFT_724018 [Marasmius fiardii PR-910]
MFSSIPFIEPEHSGTRPNADENPNSKLAFSTKASTKFRLHGPNIPPPSCLPMMIESLDCRKLPLTLLYRKLERTLDLKSQSCIVEILEIGPLTSTYRPLGDHLSFLSSLNFNNFHPSSFPLSLRYTTLHTALLTRTSIHTSQNVVEDSEESM